MRKTALQSAVLCSQEGVPHLCEGHQTHSWLCYWPCLPSGTSLVLFVHTLYGMPDCTLCICQSVFAACVCVCDYCVMYIHSIHSSGSLTLSVPNEPKWIFCLIRTYWVWGVQCSHCYRRQVLLKILTHCVPLDSNKTWNVSRHLKIGFISLF